MANHLGLEGTTLSPSLPENQTPVQLHTYEVSSASYQQPLTNVARCFSESTKFIILSPEKAQELKKKIEKLSRRIQDFEFGRYREEGRLHLITEGCTDAAKEPHGDQVSQLEDLKYQLLTTQKSFLEHIAAVFRKEYADRHSLRNKAIISEGHENESTNLQERPVTGYDDPRTRKSDKNPCSGMDPKLHTHEAKDFLEGPHEMPNENERDSRTPLKTLQDFNDHSNNIETRCSVDVLNKNESAGLALTQDEESYPGGRHSRIEDSQHSLVFSEKISARSEGGYDEDMSFTHNSTSQVVVFDDAFGNDWSDDGEASRSVTDAESEYESGIQDTGNNDGRFLSKSTGRGQIQLHESRSQQGRQIREHDIQGRERTLQDIAKDNPEDATHIQEEPVHDKAGNESGLGGIIAKLRTGAAFARTLRDSVDGSRTKRPGQPCAHGLELKNYIKTELDVLLDVLN